MPLVALPILWHLLRRKLRHKYTIPSLFFLNKIYQNRRDRWILSDFLDLLLEIAFLLFLILGIAHPYFTRSLTNAKQWVVFIDNSPSLYSELLDENSIGRKWIYDLVSRNNKTEIYLFTIDHLVSGRMPEAVTSSNDIDRFFLEIHIHTRDFQYGDLGDYVRENRLFFLPETTQLAVLSDFKANHFRRAFVVRRPVSMIDLEKSQMYIQPTIQGYPDRLLFVDEEISIDIGLVQKNLSDGCLVKIREGKNILYIEEVKKHGETIRLRPTLQFAQPGFKHLILDMEHKIGSRDRKIKRHYFLTLYISSPLNIRLHSSSQDQTLDLLKAMFKEDIERGHIRLNENKYDFSIVLDYPSIETIDFLKHGGGILFLPEEVDYRKMNEFLNTSFQTSLAIEKRLYFSSPSEGRIGARHVFKGDYQLLNRYQDIGSIYALYQAKVTGGAEDPVPFQGGGTFFARDKKIFLFPFDVRLRHSSFLLSPASLVWFYQSFLSLKRPLNVFRTSMDTPREGGYKKVAEAGSGASVLGQGVYSNEREIRDINIEPLEFTSDQVENLSSFFPRSLSIRGEEEKSSFPFFSLRSLFLGLSLISLALMLFLFYRRRKILTFSGKASPAAIAS